MNKASFSRREAFRLFGGAATAGQFGRAQTRRPNIVFIYADDLGWGDVSFNGRKEWPTPNLDRLAAEGTVFNRWYSGAPLCGPSRACLLTGKYTIHHSVRNNATAIPLSEVTIAKALKPLGYATALIGKWHGGVTPEGKTTHPLDHGFDMNFGYLSANQAWEHFPKQLYRGRELVQVSGYSADILTDEAVKFMGAHRSDPFFLYLAYIEPHFHVTAPEEDVAKFKGKFQEKDATEPYNARYAAMINRMDRGIGRVLQALDKMNLAKDTLVVFSSDNGGTFEPGNKGASNYHDSNRPLRGQKGSLEEGGIREPAVVRWPGRVPAGKKSNEIVHMMDVMPSLLAATGGKPDPAWKMDGANMLDVWMGKAKAPERTLFWESPIPARRVVPWMRAAMRGDFKLLLINEYRFLYNLAIDPAERRSVLGEYPEVAKKLEAELEEWLATATPR